MTNITSIIDKLNQEGRYSEAAVLDIGLSKFADAIGPDVYADDMANSDSSDQPLIPENDTDNQINETENPDELEAISHLIDVVTNALTEEGHSAEELDTPQGQELIEDRISQLLTDVSSSTEVESDKLPMPKGRGFLAATQPDYNAL